MFLPPHKNHLILNAPAIVNNKNNDIIMLLYNMHDLSTFSPRQNTRYEIHTVVYMLVLLSHYFWLALQNSSISNGRILKQ